MVQLKHFGDSRDYFKYDLIQFVLKSLSLNHYVFIPMLTKHREDNEGRKKPTDRGDKSRQLLEFINGCQDKSLKHWEHWLECYVRSYFTREPVDKYFFSDNRRHAYWSAFQPHLSRKKALVFVDPDTGLQTGKPSYLKRMGRDKYILNDELRFLIEEIAPSSVLMLYQHLPPNKNIHAQSVEKKLAQVRSINATVYAVAYREDDLAFLFVSKQKPLYQELHSILRGYQKSSTNAYRSLHA